jgi:hypothetical protein
VPRGEPLGAIRGEAARRDQQVDIIGDAPTCVTLRPSSSAPAPLRIGGRVC